MTFDRISWPRQTDRLSIRPATHDDLETLGGIQNQEEVAYWLESAVGSQDDYLLRLGGDGLLPRTLAIELDGTVIGEFYLRVSDGWAQVEVAEQASGSNAEIGWGLDPAHQGHGYATEVAREVVRICFEELGVRRVVASAFADNDASVRIMERLGMRCETRGIRTALHRERGWVDSVEYALLADEWRVALTADGAPR